MTEPGREFAEAISSAINALSSLVDTTDKPWQEAVLRTAAALRDLRHAHLAFHHARAIGTVSGDDPLEDLLPMIAEIESLLTAPAPGSPSKISEMALVLCARLTVGE